MTPTLTPEDAEYTVLCRYHLRRGDPLGPIITTFVVTHWASHGWVAVVYPNGRTALGRILNTAGGWTKDTTDAAFHATPQGAVDAAFASDAIETREPERTTP